MAPTDANLAEYLREAAASVPDAVALIEADGGRSMTWAELDQAVDALAHGLRGPAGAGLHAGDRVALLLGNRVEFAIAWWAVVRAGLIAVPLNPWTPESGVTDLAAASGARLLLAERETGPVARAVGLALEIPTATVGAPSYDDLARQGADRGAYPAAPGGENLAAILWTSGPSDTPRGAMLSHRALRADLEALGAVGEAAVGPADVVLLAVPLFHVYGLNAVMGNAVRAHATGVLVEATDVPGTLQAIADHGVTHVAGAPPMYAAWGEQIGLREKTATVRLFVSGAASMTSGNLARFTEVAGKPVWEGYGMTETAPVVSTTLMTGRPIPGSAGAPLPGVEVRLVDAGRSEDADDDDDPLGPLGDHDPGEIEVRGPLLFSGYWPDGADGPDADGWWATGDIGFQDDEGDLILLDRRRETISVSGFAVYPREIEVVLRELPGVAAVAVGGVADPLAGQVVAAYVVRDAHSTISADDVVEFARTRLARFKVPAQVDFVAELPYSSTGRVARGRLRGIPVLEGSADAASE